MEKTDPQQTIATPIIDQVFQQAVACHLAGQLYEAEHLYHTVLLTHPDHADAKHNLSLIKEQREQATSYLPKFKAALEADPGQGQHWLNYIDALILTGHIDDARHVLQQGQHHGLTGEKVDALAQRLDNSKQ